MFFSSPSSNADIVYLPVHLTHCAWPAEWRHKTVVAYRSLQMTTDTDQLTRPFFSVPIHWTQKQTVAYLQNGIWITRARTHTHTQTRTRARAQLECFNTTPFRNCVCFLSVNLKKSLTATWKTLKRTTMTLKRKTMVLMHIGYRVNDNDGYIFPKIMITDASRNKCRHAKQNAF